jgi:hypothetical protein
MFAFTIKTPVSRLLACFASNAALGATIASAAPAPKPKASNAASALGRAVDPKLQQQRVGAGSTKELLFGSPGDLDENVCTSDADYISGKKASNLMSIWATAHMPPGGAIDESAGGLIFQLCNLHTTLLSDAKLVTGDLSEKPWGLVEHICPAGASNVTLGNGTSHCYFTEC